MITSDGHEGIIHAISEVFPTVPWQRCQFHFSRNVVDKTPKKYQTGIRAELQEMFACNTLKEARNKKDQIIQEYQDVAETAMSCLDEGFESAMTAMILPLGMQRFFRTSNAVERLNKELKRRSQVIRNLSKRGVSHPVDGFRSDRAEQSESIGEGYLQKGVL